ncbi:MAG: hypothetical protein ACO21N_09615, partial [Candidatus Nanopelagicales bacterium]
HGDLRAQGQQRGRQVAGVRRAAAALGEDRVEAREGARLSGRAADNRLVHVARDADLGDPRPGDLVVAEVTYAAPHHLVADRMIEVRRTRAGDAWESRQGADEPDARVLLPAPAMPPR